jgi:hypothetical protein
MKFCDAAQESLCIAAPAPTLAALSACSAITALRLSDASMLSNRITGLLLTPLDTQAATSQPVHLK